MDGGVGVTRGPTPTRGAIGGENHFFGDVATDRLPITQVHLHTVRTNQIPVEVNNINRK